MKKSKKQKCTFDLLPFHVIEAASTGDTEAIQAVLKLSSKGKRKKYPKRFT